eukprot:2309240-Prymnesium_polylepis.1
MSIRMRQPPERALTVDSLYSAGNCTSLRISSMAASDLRSAGAPSRRNWRTVTSLSTLISWRMYHVRRSIGKPLMSLDASRLSRVVLPVPFWPMRP